MLLLHETESSVDGTISTLYVIQKYTEYWLKIPPFTIIQFFPSEMLKCSDFRGPFLLWMSLSSV